METNQETTRGTRRTMFGKVVSAAADKTITVEVERTTQHPLYRKTIRIRKKFYAHDENNQANVGDKVEIMGTRPLSKKKCWRLVQITEQAPQE
jgi:small subunit ribosomal protein S17